MVFEDALTILSYASPYEVEMFIESRNASNTSSLLRTPPPPHKISHPLFRSQSIADLQKVSSSQSEIKFKLYHFNKVAVNNISYAFKWPH